MSFFDTNVFHWGVLPVLIFLSRVADMSMDTIRIILMSKGSRILPPVLGFFQVLLWLLVIRQIFLNLSSVLCYVAYAGGFATGTYVGMILEERLAIGTQVIRLITRRDASELIRYLRARGYGVTSMDARGSSGEVNVIFTIIQRSELNRVLKIIKNFNPNAFYTIEDIRMVSKNKEAFAR
jgi:uncharacterized protein YebE (UPF0316 family)